MAYLTNEEMAKIAISKNLIKEYKNSNSERTVYLNNGTEFQIYLKNPYQTHTGIKISVNNKPIGNMLVLRPGQSFWLDRFLNENKKFLFSTYEVENSKEMEYATSQNGKVKIEFFHEREKNPYVSSPIQVSLNSDNTFRRNDVTYGYSSDCVNTTLTSSINLNSGTAFSASTYLNGGNETLSLEDCSCTITGRPKVRSKKAISADVDTKATRTLEKQGTMETGRVEKGSMSNQKFDYCDLEFEYWPFKTEEIQILPTSRKQIRPEETRRKYCSQCGKKVGPKDKFCSNCGAKLD